jgi:hypothetical protein
MALRSSYMTWVMLVIFSILVAISFMWPAEARFMPNVVGIPAILLCLLQLVLDSRKSPGREHSEHSIAEEMREAEARVSRMTGRAMHFDVAHDMELPEEEVVSDDEAQKREKIVWAAFTAMLASIVVFGFPVTVPLFLTAFLFWIARFSLPRAALYAAIATAVMLLVFETVLQTELHRGILTPLIVDWFRP